jgi:hypothetical protein
MHNKLAQARLLKREKVKTFMGEVLTFKCFKEV